jgi:pre-mRNA-splicing factor RBM22/SLT11
MSRLSADAKTDFPILCEDCLGENPYIRMSKEVDGKDCKICSRAFTLFKWSDKDVKRKTEICQLCAKLKNVCQCCILDLDYKLESSVRDSVLSKTTPNSNVNTEYYTQNMARKEFKQELTVKHLLSSHLKQESSKRRVCEFFQKGNCTKGNKCLFKHEIKIETGKSLEYKAPQDLNIKTIYIKNVNSEITEADIREEMYAFGEITSLVILRRAKCAFLTFGSRTSAEMAVETFINNFEIKGHALKVQWGKSSKGDLPNSNSKTLSTLSTLGPATQPPPPGTGQEVLYPSMDPRMLGTATETFGKDDF